MPAMQRKPSDFNAFRVTVHNASATLLEFDQYIHVYDELLKLLFWNYEIDTPLLVDQREDFEDGESNG